ncbi:hypothetical protein [Roseicyclus marinus]|jgi:membrane associated rhomboid family serine protease|uniref:Uncharacterized protein n=2 Tax=Roseicyclus TaxID=336277 RepID=A0AA48KKR1_9RHOB|nr:hypothetical protein MACH21_15420 [Roseicyclus marinus]
MNMKFWLTAGEPRPRYALLVAIGVVIMMSLTYPIWQPGGPGMAAFAAVTATIISHVSAKLIMRR